MRVYEKARLKYHVFRSQGSNTVGKHLIQIMSTLLPLRRICSGGKLSDKDLNVVSRLATMFPWLSQILLSSAHRSLCLSLLLLRSNNHTVHTAELLTALLCCSVFIALLAALGTACCTPVMTCSRVRKAMADNAAARTCS